MRILFIIDSLVGGGAEKLLNDLLPLFVQKNNDCVVLSFSLENAKYADSLISNGVSVESIPPNIKTHFGKIKYIKKRICSISPDLVHVHLFPALYYCSLIKLCSLKRLPPFFYTEHSTSNRRRKYHILSFVEKIIYSKYTKIFSISEDTQISLINWIRPKKTEKFSVIENGIDLKKVESIKAVNRENIYADIKQNDILICMIGSFTEQKNHTLAIDILSKLPKRYKLVLLGEGKKQDEIRIKANNNGVTDRVIFLGFRKDTISILKACDLMLIPSKWEGFGLVAVEGMACAKPIVASNVPGLASVVSNYGLLCELQEPDSFVDSIMSIENNKMYNFYSRLSFERAKKYDIQKTAENYLREYEKTK